MSDDFFQKTDLGASTLVLATGDIIDNSNVKFLTKEIEAALLSEYKSLIIDMSKLEFLSSAGVGIIFSYVRKFRGMGGDIVLCNVSDSILYVMNELDVANYLTIAKNVQAASSLCGAAAAPK